MTASAIRVAGIFIYPIKSTAGIAVDECVVEPQGLALDRRWMVVDEAGEFLSGREFPILTQIRSQTESGGLRITAPGMTEMRVLLPTDAAKARWVRVWSDECRALGADQAIDDWFSRLLGTRAHLVYMHDRRQRPVDFDYGRPGDRVSFADGFPLLLVSEASLADLNARLSESMSMRRFRPNLVVGGCGPYEEDQWRTISMGETRFDSVKSCSRCVFTTVDPDSAEKHPRQEPLRTLGAYRRAADGGVLFGQNLIPRVLGTLRVGDVVTVLNGSD